MPTVHLVDGTFELFRCFHGAPRARDEDGHEIGAARGLLWTLTKLLRTVERPHVAVVFDRMAPPRRDDRSDGADLRRQGALAVDVVRALGIPAWVAYRGQADDLLASAAARLDAARIVLCTTDKDLLQCVRGGSVVTWDRIHDRVTDEEALFARFGVRPEQIPDLHALIGDPSDGLPGIPGFGPKSAAAVLAAFPTIRDIPEDPTRWPKLRGVERLVAAFVRHRADALVVRDVAVLRTDLPVRATVDELRWRGPGPELAALAVRLGAPEVPEKLPSPSTPPD